MFFYVMHRGTGAVVYKGLFIEGLRRERLGRFSGRFLNPNSWGLASASPRG